MTELGSQALVPPPFMPLKKNSNRWTASERLVHKNIDRWRNLCQRHTLYFRLPWPSGLNPSRDPEGWFHTGDLGTLTEKGTLKYSDDWTLNLSPVGKILSRRNRDDGFIGFSYHQTGYCGTYTLLNLRTAPTRFILGQIFKG